MLFIFLINVEKANFHNRNRSEHCEHLIPCLFSNWGAFFRSMRLVNQTVLTMGLIRKMRVTLSCLTCVSTYESCVFSMRTLFSELVAAGIHWLRALYFPSCHDFQHAKDEVHSAPLRMTIIKQRCDCCGHLIQQISLSTFQTQELPRYE